MPADQERLSVLQISRNSNLWPTQSQFIKMGRGTILQPSSFICLFIYFHFWSAYGPPLSKQTKGGVGLILIYFKI